MPPKIKKNILLMVTNVGSTSSELNSLEEKPFIDKTKYAMKLLVEKKIFLQQKDEIGIITMGEETNNVDDMENIKIYSEHLLVPNWEMVKYINNLTSTNFPCNWIEGLNVSLNFIEREVVNPEFRLFLVIFNNFKENDESINKYDVDIIANELKNYNNLHLLFVGEKPLNEISWSQNSTSLSEKCVLSIIEKINAQYEQINIFIESKELHVSPPINSLPWKFNLEWGQLNIPCASYVKVTEIIKFSSWKMYTTSDSQDKLDDFSDPLEKNDFSKFHNISNVIKENFTIDIHRNEINPEKIINGYKFGGKYIPLSEEDEIPMKYTNSKKGMLVYGFVPQNDVKLEYWSGSGSRVIVPSTNEYFEAFYSFVQAMVDKQCVAIVRKVYADNNLPKMGVLFPKMDDEHIWCLIHLDIPFIHDMRTIQSRPIKSLDKTIDTEKWETLENFINSMTISENELLHLNFGLFPNILSQYHWNAVADRALCLENPLLPLNNYLKKYLVPPEYVCVKAKPYLEKLNKLFGSYKISKNLNKKQNYSSIVLKTNENVENIINEINEDILKNKNTTDEESKFFENVNFNMKELDDM